MPLPNMTPAQLLAGANFLAARFPGPDVELVKNEVGNLAIMNAGAYAGHLDLRDGSVVVFTDEFGDDEGNGDE